MVGRADRLYERGGEVERQSCSIVRRSFVLPVDVDELNREGSHCDDEQRDSLCERALPTDEERDESSQKQLRPRTISRSRVMADRDLTYLERGVEDVDD